MGTTGEQTRVGAGAGPDETVFSEEELVQVASTVLHALGAAQETADLVATSLALSNLVGHDSHGIVRLVQYSEMVRAGQIKPAGRPRVLAERGAVAQVDGGWGFGQPAAQLATRICAGLASTSGVAAVSISSCNHIGRLGEYVASIAVDNLMGMAFCNSGPVVAPYGGSGRVMGTNPFAWSAPLRRGPVVLDFATSKVAEGKLKIALAEGRTIAEGSIVDSEGRPSVDPADFYAGGALLAFGEHKGSGMSMLIELTAGLVSKMGTSVDPDYQGGNGALIMALDIMAFTELDRYFDQAEVFAHEAKRVGGGSSGADVLLPGELEARTLQARRVGGVFVAAEIRRQVTALAGELDVDVGRFALR
jgi:LDH2 family malate/lactate/ureidoglycolate dehydrogenase